MAKDRIFGLDLMRATAIALVIFGHLWWLLPDKNGLAGQLTSLSGFFGVELFFVLSGFLIGRILLRQFLETSFDRAVIVTFLKRRWLRTLPNYYLILPVNFLLAFFVSGTPPDWRYLFFLQNLAWPMPVFFTESWSLSVEEFAYLLLPAALMLAGLLNGRRSLSVFFSAVLVLIVFVFGFRQIYHGIHGATSMEFWNTSLKSVVIYRLDAIFLGVIAAWFSHRFPSVWRRTAGFMAFAGLIVVCFLSFGVGFLGLSQDRFPMFWNVFYLPLASLGFCFFLPICSRWIAGGLLSRPVSFVSRISYALYLVHYGVVLRCVRQLEWSGPFAQGMLYLGGSIFLAWIVYRFYETRFMRWRDQNLPE